MKMWYFRLEINTDKIVSERWRQRVMVKKIRQTFKRGRGCNSDKNARLKANRPKQSSEQTLFSFFTKSSINKRENEVQTWSLGTPVALNPSYSLWFVDEELQYLLVRTRQAERWQFVVKKGLLCSNPSLGSGWRSSTALRSSMRRAGTSTHMRVSVDPTKLCRISPAPKSKACCSQRTRKHRFQLLFIGVIPTAR